MPAADLHHIKCLMVIGLQSQENPHAEGDYRVTMGKAVSPG
ncbi:hypothetical protein [Aminobacter ciceronei]|nr:hypothetical protein [Aminobacter ciceronei]